LQGFPEVFPLEDATYDVIVVDATDDPSGAVVRLELAITAGAHKGEVVRITGHNLQRDPLDLLGLPATLTVAGGVPTLQLD
jgi:hypothetical protein